MKEILYVFIGKQTFHLLVGIAIGMLLHIEEHLSLLFFTLVKFLVCHCLAHLNCSLIQSIAFERWLNTVTLLTPTSSATS